MPELHNLVRTLNLLVEVEALTTAMLKVAALAEQPAGAGAVGVIKAVTPWAETAAARAETARTVLVNILIVELLVVERLSITEVRILMWK